MRIAHFLQKFVVATLMVLVAVVGRTQDPLTSLAQPGNEATAITFGTSPSLTVFGSTPTLYIAYKSNSNNDLMLTSSTDGSNFSTPTTFSSAVMDSGTSPAIDSENGTLIIAFVHSGYVWTMTSANGTTFSGPYEAAYYLNSYTEAYIKANSSPSLAYFNGESWLAVVQNGSGSSTSVASYEANGPGGVYNSTNNYCGGYSGEMPQTGAAVGLATFNNYLWYGYQTQGGQGGHNLLVCSTNGTSSSYSTTSTEIGGGVSATAYSGYLYFSYKAYSSHNLELTEVNSSGFLTSNAPGYSDIEINGNQEINPSAAVLNSVFYLAYTENNSGHHMFLTYN